MRLSALFFGAMNWYFILCLLVIPASVEADDQCSLICRTISGLCDPGSESRCDTVTNSCMYLYLNDITIFTYTTETQTVGMRPVQCDHAKQMLGVFLIQKAAQEQSVPAVQKMDNGDTRPARDHEGMDVFGEFKPSCILS